MLQDYDYGDEEDEDDIDLYDDGDDYYDEFSIYEDFEDDEVDEVEDVDDEDGDGVEDNVEKTWDELDRFYDPLSFGDAEEINNTHHGSLPGHVRLEEYEAAPVSHQSNKSSQE